MGTLGNFFLLAWLTYPRPPPFSRNNITILSFSEIVRLIYPAVYESLMCIHLLTTYYFIEKNKA